VDLALRMTTVTMDRTLSLQRATNSKPWKGDRIIAQERLAP